jgi:hypothetical protein
MLVKELTRGNRTLRHTRDTDMFGFLRDNFEIVETAPDGFRTLTPFRAPIKVNNYSASDPIDTTTDYTDEEYEAMF